MGRRRPVESGCNRLFPCGTGAWLAHELERLRDAGEKLRPVELLETLWRINVDHSDFIA